MLFPTYFILDGCHAYTSNKKPASIYFSGVVNLKTAEYPIGRKINVVAVKPLEDPHLYTAAIPKKNIPVYKSNLQKCVRRGLKDRAIRTTYAMMSTDLCDVLRRIPIIMIEDVLPHPSIVPLVWWMMAATKGYLLSDWEVGWILGIIHMICDIEQYQVKNSRCKPKGELEDWSNLSSLQSDLFWALEFRKAYRGMYCDVEMIEYLQRQWLGRFSNSMQRDSDDLWDMLMEIQVEPIDLSSLGVCDKNDLILEAFDQHCFSWIPKKLGAKFPQYTEYEIKGAIWYYRSRINKRSVCKGSVSVEYIDDLELVYDVIKDELEELCRWIFEKLV